MLRKDDVEKPAPFVMASLIPGGRFVVVAYIDGRIDLKEIKITEGKWQLRDVARYRLDDLEQRRAVGLSQPLTETILGYPLVAYMNPGEQGYDRSFARFRTTLIKLKACPPFSFSSSITSLAP